MFSVFSAQGTVVESRPLQTQGGASGHTLLLKVGEWTDRNGNANESFLEATAWGEAREQAASALVGDAVAVSGNLKCTRSQSGYWNARISVREAVVISRPQPPQNRAAQAAQAGCYAASPQGQPAQPAPVFARKNDEIEKKVAKNLTQNAPVAAPIPEQENAPETYSLYAEDVPF